MGFFSSILSAAAPILGAFLGTPAAAAPAVSAPAPVTTAVIPAVTRVSAVAGGISAGITAADRAAIGAVSGAVQGCPTTGSLRRRTIIETFDPGTGAICRREIHAGAVAVFQSDVAAANRLNRALRRLNKAQPRRLVQKSEIAMLKDQVVSTALRKAASFNGTCPS